MRLWGNTPMKKTIYEWLAYCDRLEQADELGAALAIRSAVKGSGPMDLSKELELSIPARFEEALKKVEA